MSTSVFVACFVALTPAALRAIDHLIPIAFPAGTPGKWQLTDRANFGGQITFFAHAWH